MSATLPYDYTGLATQYLSERSEAVPASYSHSYLPSQWGETGRGETGQGRDIPRLKECLSPLKKLTLCDDDVESGGVLPPLLSVMATVDQVAVEGSVEKGASFVEETLKIYPYSIFLLREACHLSPPLDVTSASADAPQVIRDTLTHFKGRSGSELDFWFGNSFSRMALAVLQCTTGVSRKSCYPSGSKPMLVLPPIWMAYCEPATHLDGAGGVSLPQNYETVSSVSALVRSFRLLLLDLMDGFEGDGDEESSLRRELLGGYFHTIDSFLVPPPSDNSNSMPTATGTTTTTTTSFRDFFALSKSRLYALKKELECEGHRLASFPGASDTVNAVLTRIDELMSDGPQGGGSQGDDSQSPSLRSLRGTYFEVLGSSSRQLQRKLDDIGMGAFPTAADAPSGLEVLHGGFQSGNGDASLIPTLKHGVEARQAAEGKLLSSNDSGLPPKSWISLYERYLSECPTVPQIWMEYVKSLVEAAAFGTTSLPKDQSPDNETFFYDLARDVVQRGIKNVPWCVDLHKLRVALVGYPFPAKLDDKVRGRTLRKAEKLVERTCKNSFLSYDQKIQVWLAGCKVVKTMLIEEKKKQRGGNDDVDDDDEEESHLIDDLIGDLREFYDNATKWSNENKPSKRFYERNLIKSRALTESLVICDDCDEGEIGLGANANVSASQPNVKESETMRCWEKLVQVDKFNPSSWESYIAFVLHKEKVHGFGTVSQLFSRAFKTISGRDERAIDVNGCLRLGKSLVEFEEEFNSLVWVLRRQTFVSSKMAKIGQLKQNATAVVYAPATAAAGQGEGEDEGGRSEERPQEEKKRKRQDDGESAAGKKGAKKAKHFVMVGDVQWQADPTTVHVKNLHAAADERDVVKVFENCGKLVHVRVLRDKEFCPNSNKMVFTKSKGRALVQFLREDSVEAALAYHNQVSINDQLIDVERSNMPAVESVISLKGDRIGAGTTKKGNGANGQKKESHVKKAAGGSSLIPRRRKGFVPSRVSSNANKSKSKSESKGKANRSEEVAEAGSGSGHKKPELPKNNAAFSAMFK